MSNERECDVIIVGGGHNGLVSAFYLGLAGLKVLVLERRHILGGACATEELFDGYRVSSCSYACWMLQPKVISDLELARHGFRYYNLDPITFNPYPDGSYLFSWHDEVRTEQEVARLNERDAKAYQGFNNFWHRASGLLNPFLLKPPPSLEEVAAYAESIDELPLFERLQTASSAEICEEYFEDPRIQAALARIEDIGDPWASGSAWSEAYFHCNSHSGFGFAVVEGGMGSITKAMAAAASTHDVTIRTESEVSEILVDDGRVAGVRLVDGEEILVETVLSNADPKRTLLNLVDPNALDSHVRETVESLSTQTSYLKFHAVMDRLPDISQYLGRAADPKELGKIYIAPSLQHFQRAFNDTREGKPAREPIVHIQIPGVYDSSLTDRDGYVISIWAQFAPPRLAEGTWEERRQEVGDALIDYVSEFIPNFRTDMQEWMLFTPLDIEQRIGMTDGNIRHLDIIPEQMLDARPLHGSGYATPIQGLYLCGSGTHPGGEVTGAPGHNAAHAVLQDRAAQLTTG